MPTSTLTLERRVAALTERKAAIAVGRAAWGLFALLSIWKKQGTAQKIALPSFLCQSPLAAVLGAGWEPEFCDVDLETGNVPAAEWQRVIDAGVDAVLFVHLFGNVGDADHIADICRDCGVYFIEDAAQSLGGAWKGRPCGSVGDASIISFGHTKLIDVGQGGMVLCNDPVLVQEVRTFDAAHSASSQDTSTVAKQFRDLFYAARRQLGTAPDRARENFKGLLDIYAPLVPAKWHPEIADKVHARLDQLETAVSARREKNQLCVDMLRGSALVPLKLSSESVPWRAVFRLPGIDWAAQEAISEAVRGEGVDISNWYIPSHWLMRQARIKQGTLEKTERLSQEIFQLWIDADTDMDKIKRAAAVFASKLTMRN